MIELLNYRAWALDARFFERAAPFVLSAFESGRSIDSLVKKTEKKLDSRYNGDTVEITADSDFDPNRLITATSSTGQKVAIIPIIGTMTKRGDACSYGMKHYLNLIAKANAVESIAAIVLDMDTPGGSVDGTPEFGEAVKKSKKPVLVYGDGMVASAGYWVASQARYIMASKNNPTEFGSIGVLYMHENWGKYIESNIGSVEIIRAPQSTDKARVNVIEPLTDDLRLELRSELKDIANTFKSTVKRGRKTLNTGEENIFTGKMYKSKEALEMGMIDGIGTFQEAVDKAAKLALNKHNFSKSNKSNPQTMTLKEWFSGKKEAGEAGGEETVTINASELSELKVDMQAAQEQLDAANANVSAKEAEVTQLKADISAKEATITEKEAKIAELQAIVDEKPAPAATTVVSKEDKGPEYEGGEDPMKKFETSFDREMKVLKSTINPN